MFATDLQAAAAFFSYLAGAAGLIALIDWLTRIPKEWIRKTYHLMITFAMLFLVLWFNGWYSALLTLLAILLLAFVLLRIAYRFGILQRLSVDRQKGVNEVSRQIIYLAISYSGLIILFWGLLGPEWKFLAILAVMVWGFGDAAAALVGRFLGRKKLKGPFFDPKKTVEGLLANAAASALISMFVLLVGSDVTLPVALASSVVLGAVGAVIEAASRRGRDTIVLPWSLAALAYPVLTLLRYVEGRWLG